MNCFTILRTQITLSFFPWTKLELAIPHPLLWLVESQKNILMELLPPLLASLRALEAKETSASNNNWLGNSDQCSHRWQLEKLNNYNNKSAWKDQMATKTVRNYWDWIQEITEAKDGGYFFLWMCLLIPKWAAHRLSMFISAPWG